MLNQFDKKICRDVKNLESCLKSLTSDEYARSLKVTALKSYSL